MIASVRQWGAILCVCLCTAGLMAADAGTVQSGTESTDMVRPSVYYVMASPRACLIDAPFLSSTDGARYGAVDNFARRDGSLRIRVGTKVCFQLSDQLEGVWYSDAFGTLGTSLEIQWYACNADHVEIASERRLSDCWITIGRDAVRDTRQGPSIGHAHIGVPVRFLRTGVYYLRGIVRTFACPLVDCSSIFTDRSESATEMSVSAPDGTISTSAADTQGLRIVDRDVVEVKVVVVPQTGISNVSHEPMVTDPDTENDTQWPRDPECGQVKETELGDE